MDAAIDMFCGFGGSEKQETELMTCGISGGTSMKAPQFNIIPVFQDQWGDDTMGNQQVFLPTGIAIWTIYFESDGPPPVFVGQVGRQLCDIGFGDGWVCGSRTPGRHPGDPENQEKPSKPGYCDDYFYSHVFFTVAR